MRYGSSVHIKAIMESAPLTQILPRRYASTSLYRFFVAKTAGGAVFGGYTAGAWTGGSGNCDWRTDAHAFLFSNNFKHEQTDTYPDMSVHDCGTEGPTFGAGHDFYTNLSTDAYVNLGNSFICRVGDPGSEECINDFAVGSNPNMIELEVYAAQ
jgi:hypothetical protein